MKMTVPSDTDLKHWLATTAGLDPELLERSTLDHWVGQRLRQLGLPNVREYLSLLREDAGELERLVGEISVPETCFFRYPASFQLLVEIARQRRTLAPAPETVRMLSVACATGEEPYSMAMAAVYAGWSYRQIVVDAVDRNHGHLETARAAVYGQRSFRQPTPDWAETWLLRSSDGVRVDPHVASTVNFAREDILDVLSPNMKRSYDIIFCRNLLIYLNDDAQKALIAKLASWLSPHGLLFVGHAESLDWFHFRLQRVSAPHAFALRLHQGDDPPPSTGPSPRPHRRPVTTGRKPVRTKTKRLLPVETTAMAADPARPPADVSVDAETTLQRARALADTGDLALSLAAAKRVLASQGPNASILELLGNVHLALGNLDDAHDALTKALYFDPAHEDVLLQLSMIHDELGDRSQAERYRQRAARSHQTKPDERQP